MGQREWFRNVTWDAEVELAFEQRLRRARDKSQYLRIQASYLAERHPATALGLLDRYFALGEHFDMAQAHVDRARALLALRDIEGALISYEAALQRERQYPRLHTGAYLDYPSLVIEARLELLYLRAFEVLTMNAHRLLFPVDHYRAHGMRALLLQHFGRVDQAQAEARLAITAAEQTHSGFRYHRHVGLVRRTDDDFGKQVAALAAQQSDGLSSA